MNARNEVTEVDIYAAINRMVKGLGSQKAFAERAGVSEAFISKIINGDARITRSSKKIPDAIGVEWVQPPGYWQFKENAHV